MTTFKRLARLHQAKWREARDLPRGSSPYAGGPNTKPIGSRLELEFARESCANFLTAEAIAAVRHRLSYTDPHEMLSKDRLWADLLSSMPMCFNLFGDVHDNPERGQRLLQQLWPDAVGEFRDIKFEWSPGRRDRDYLGNRSAFDVALLTRTQDGAAGAVGIETKYHEHLPPSPDPGPALERYVEITERSGAFVGAATKSLPGSDLQQIWQDHLLLLSMLQHPTARWQWGRFVLVYPQGNIVYADAARRYRELLRDDQTFGTLTIEHLLKSGGFTPAAEGLLRERYLF